jgi:hypothetical protein
MDHEKNSKFEFLTSRIEDVNDHLNDISDQTSKKFNIIRENVKKSKLTLDYPHSKTNRRRKPKSRVVVGE